MAIFYTPDILQNPVLPEDESKHCVRVLRKQVGDRIELIDGLGSFYEAEIVEANPKRCLVQVLSKRPDPSERFQSYIAVAPTKNPERIEWFLEKATEVGLGGIAFIQSQHSERKTIKVERMDRILISALKQSIKALKPELRTGLTFKQYVTEPFEGQKIICHCHPEPKPFLQEICASDIPVRVLIGPEGDFSPEEVAFAREQGYVAASLGDTRLRTETAAFVAAHIVALKNQR